MNYVVIGGGLAGLMAARRLSLERSDSSVTILERNQCPGGILAGVHYPEQNLYFDQGTHIFRETGNNEIDDFIIHSVPAGDLIHFAAGGEGDVAGSVFNGRLQPYSHFPDILSLADGNELTGSIISHLNAIKSVSAIDRLGPLLTSAKMRFGAAYTERVLSPIFSAMYQRSTEELSGFALILPGLSRVVGHSFSEWEKLAGSSLNYRSVFAVPDQSRLPIEFQQNKRSYYSRYQGSRAFINGVADSLENNNVRILTGANILSIDLGKLEVKFTDAFGTKQTLSADGIILANGVIGAARLLRTNLAEYGFDQPMLLRIVNLLLDVPIESNLCYFYGLDPNLDFYRVTNYRAFSGVPDDCRITIEVIGDRDITTENLPMHLVSQLSEIDFLKRSKPIFSRVEELGAGFPAPTTRNMQSLLNLGDDINSILPEKVITGGIGTNSGLFFQNEIVEDIYTKASNLL